MPSLLLTLAVGLAAGGCATSPVGGSPTATPTVPTTPQARLSALIHRVLQGTQSQGETAYDAARRTVVVTITLTDGIVPRRAAEIARAQERVKSLCFQAEQTVWTSGLPVTMATVSVLGPMYDDYADLIVRGYGGAILSSAAAERLAWASLTADGAWDLYDQVWLSSSFFPNEQFGVAPTATPSPR